ncbi:MAG: GPW/gp25 family protein, partial [Candidatus Limnocylindrales bacterium]
PRITVLGVDVTVDNASEGTLYIDIRYAKRGTNDPRNLVFPFYVIPEEG